MEKFVQLAADIGKLWGNYGASYRSGICNTLILALVATVIGCVIGFFCGVLNTIPCAKSDPPVKRFFLGLIRAVVRVYVEVIRGTPMVLQAVFLYYGLPYFTDNALKFTNIWVAAIVVVSVNTGAYMAESVRGGIISIDPGQTEGAKAIGMTHVQTMLSVILPQALRNIMPQIGNNFIINVKDTSVMFIIGFPDFFAAHRAAVGASYLYFPSATVEMAGYLTMTLIASFLLRWVEKRLDGSSSYELVQSDQLTMTAGTYNHPDKGTPFDEHSKEYRKNTKASLKNRNFSARGDR
ncbi:amino acid ABC transporter permease [uncultured Oscillibacter sp.]|uniref:amino acid ABC transporter permease n=1 Tax=uncultured Oscillibacter sp. TaxID=876091 RepID=UPI0025E824F9|nr:amino acid ABC transporter permease [uncultured Oscillibacter sp.]